MVQRMVVIWFPHLLTDWQQRNMPAVKEKPFVLAQTGQGRRVAKAVSSLAYEKGLRKGMVVADCRALLPALEVYEYDENRAPKLLHALAEWCIRFSPVVSVDLPDGLVLDASGCTHLWGGDLPFMNDLHKRLTDLGYTLRLGMADTIGCAWALSRYGPPIAIAAANEQEKVLVPLPPAALRLEPVVLEKLAKLGFDTIGSFLKMPGPSLRRRFGKILLQRLAQALGTGMELLDPVQPVNPYHERLPALEPVSTPLAIELALKELLESLCSRLNRESRGLRKCGLKCYRLDGKVQIITIGTSRASRNAAHLFRLFESRISEIEPGLGIELFVLEAGMVEELYNTQDVLWTTAPGNAPVLAELIDRLESKTGEGSVYRYLPAPRYWPEHAVKRASSLSEKPLIPWPLALPRPLHLLPVPEKIEVIVPIPDYPPLLFIYKKLRHTVKKADGPERIEQEWWTQNGEYRDYYCVEDEKGARYWLFRSGDYLNQDVKWFLHGFFA